jgi:ribosomal protein L40E
MIDDRTMPPTAICDGCGTKGETDARRTRIGTYSVICLPEGWRLFGTRVRPIHVCGRCGAAEGQRLEAESEPA